MYPLGILFGLGFDTSSEIALLGISSIQATKGTSIWVILIFPILFTGKFDPLSRIGTFLTPKSAGMCLIDTLDGALMLTLYTLPSTSSKQEATYAKDPITFLYYSIVLTGLTVLVAIMIGVLQLLTMIGAVAEPKGKFWKGVEVVGNHYDIFGGAICGSFVFVGLVSVVAYRPWRRRMDRSRAMGREQVEVNDELAAEDGVACGSVLSQEGLAGSQEKYKGSKSEVGVRSREDLDDKEN